MPSVSYVRILVYKAPTVWDMDISIDTTILKINNFKRGETKEKSAGRISLSDNGEQNNTNEKKKDGQTPNDKSLSN